MRIIAGKYRSRRLSSPRGIDTRPTSDRLRETLFNVLASRVPGSTWLDLFAGSGSVGIEALSRGAKQVCFVESDARAVSAIRQNLKALGITTQFEIIVSDISAALRLLDRRSPGCDLCFLDPPYKMEALYSRILNFLSASHLLKPAAIVIAEHEKHFDLGEVFGALARYRKVSQGDSVLSFYRLATAAPASPEARGIVEK